MLELYIDKLKLFIYIYNFFKKKTMILKSIDAFTIY